MVTRRDAFVLEKAKHFNPPEIEILLVREGFAPLSRPGIYKVLTKNGVKPLDAPASRKRRSK